MAETKAQEAHRRLIKALYFARDINLVERNIVFNNNKWYTNGQDGGPNQVGLAALVALNPAAQHLGLQTMRRGSRSEYRVPLYNAYTEHKAIKCYFHITKEEYDPVFCTRTNKDPEGDLPLYLCRMQDIIEKFYEQIKKEESA